MNNFYRKPNLGVKLKQRILDLCRQVNAHVLTRHPDADHSDYWGLCEFKTAEIVSYIDFEFHKNDIHYPLKDSFEQVLDDIPEFKEFLKEFNLHPYFGKAIAGNFGVHKHAFAPDATWNLCVLDKNTENSKVGFHFPVEGRDLYGPVVDEYFYDHLDNDRPVTTELSIDVGPEDIYSFNVWQWHSFTVPENKKTDVYLFYFKNAVTEEDIDNIIKKLEAYE